MDVGKVSGPQEPFLNQPRQEDQRRRRAEAVRSGDHVNISPEAQKAAEVKRLVSMVKKIPEVRPEKVAEAKKRIQSETTPENVNRTVAQRIIEDLL